MQIPNILIPTVPPITIHYYLYPQLLAPAYFPTYSSVCIKWGSFFSVRMIVELSTKKEIDSLSLFFILLLPPIKPSIVIASASLQTSNTDKFSSAL